jgi:membrane protease YdiL (CAAX protease family)
VNPVTWIWRQWELTHEECLERPPDKRDKKTRKGPGAVESPARSPVDWRPLVVLLVTAVSLTLQEYLGDRSVFARLVPPPLKRDLTGNWELWSFCWWSGWRVVGYLLLPLAVVVLMPGERLRDYGWSFKGFTKHLKVYVLLYLAVLPLVVWMSTTKDFQRIYPFYKLAHRSGGDLLAWELLYAAQFLSLEFFFRGFMLHGMKRAIGAHAIWVMAVPYCMIHYGKTMGESLAAIVAGLVLGTVALRTRSIWGGVLIHVGVALTMDLLCLKYLGQLRR